MSRTLIFLLLLSIQSLYAQKLSPESQISVISCGVGEELYSVFGHTSLRVQDPTLKIDQTFDYGTFNFSTPNFYLKFIRGKLNYALSSRTFKRFKREYERKDRSLLSQNLDLSLAERQRIFDNLKENLLKENRFYKYDFFFDNCVSRQIVLLERSRGEDWQFDSELVKQMPTYRAALQPYLRDKPWTKFGINLILGIHSDRKPQRFEEIFLPAQLKLLLGEIKKANGKQLVNKESIIRPENPSDDAGWYRLLPLLVSIFLLIMGLFVGWREYNTKKHIKLFDFFLFFVVGLAGCLFLGMWLLTDHTATHANLNLLWAIPFHLFFSFSLWGEKAWRFKIPYIRMSLLISLIPLIFYAILPQQIPYPAIPLVLLLAFRLSLLDRRLRVNH